MNKVFLYCLQQKPHQLSKHIVKLSPTFKKTYLPCQLIILANNLSVFLLLNNSFWLSPTGTASETRRAPHRYNGAGHVEGGLHKGQTTTASYIIGQHGVECNRIQLQFEAQDEQADTTPNTVEDCTVALPPDTEEKPAGPPVEGNDGLQSNSPERDGFENTDPDLHI